MHLSSQKYKLAELNRINLDASARLMAEVFLAENKVWATLNPSPEQTYHFMLAKTTEMLDWQDELRANGTIRPDTFLSFVWLLLPRSTSTATTTSWVLGPTSNSRSTSRDTARCVCRSSTSWNPRGRSWRTRESTPETKYQDSVSMRCSQP